MQILVSGAVSDAYYAGLEQGGLSPEDFDLDNSQEADNLVADQMAHIDGFVQAVQDGCEDRAAVFARVDLWADSVAAAGTTGLNTAKASEVCVFELVGDASEESCETCQRLLGKKHTRKYIKAHGYEVKPGNPNFECGCWNCPHDWVPVNG